MSSPLPVSRAMAVVMVRVAPSMLPPTISATPRLGDQATESGGDGGERAAAGSPSSVQAAPRREAPRVSAVSRMRGSAPLTNAIVSAAISGASSTVSPITMAVRV
ncbi:MAG: hypothetical protein U0802_15705 [Candidatus Binatia bacterium]